MMRVSSDRSQSAIGMGKGKADGIYQDKSEHYRITKKRNVIPTSYNIHGQTLKEASKPVPFSHYRQ